MSTDAGSGKLHLHVDPAERGWMRASIVVLVIFAIAIAIAGFMLGIQVPTEEQRVDPGTIANQPEWAAPAAGEPDLRVQELVPGSKYVVHIVASMWLYSPNQIPDPASDMQIPVGAEVTFYVTSQDVQHGFKLQNTNVNFMAIPGEVSTLTTTFKEPGTYVFVCTEYCGTGHAAMSGSITITE